MADAPTAPILEQPTPPTLEPGYIAHRVQTVLPPGVLQFDGPANFHVFGAPYVTLGAYGVVQPGLPARSCSSPGEALAKHLEQIRTFTEGATQIAWRRRTTVEGHTDFETGKTAWRATSRLAVWR